MRANRSEPLRIFRHTNRQEIDAMKPIGRILMFAVCLMVLALPYDAAADCRVWTSLSATPDGEAVGAIGRAEAWSDNAGAQQSFMVEVGATVPDGSQLFVFANGDPAGSMTIAGGIGALDLGNGSLFDLDLLQQPSPYGDLR